MIVGYHDEARQIDSISRESPACPVTLARLIGLSDGYTIAQNACFLWFHNYFCLLIKFRQGDRLTTLNILKTQHLLHVLSARVRIPLRQPVLLL